MAGKLRVNPISYASILALVVSTVGTAQSRTWEIGALVGGGPSVVTASLGGVPDGELLITFLSVTRSFVHWKRFNASYFGEALPFVVVTKIPNAQKIWDGEGPDLGAGLAPVGLRLSLNLGRSILAFAEGNGGGVAFARAMPEPEARSFLRFAGKHSYPALRLALRLALPAAVREQRRFPAHHRASLRRGPSSRRAQVA